MAIRPLNSVAGFSVGETPANIILANGDITTTNITTTGVSNLNSVGNIRISGGSAGQVLATDGSGNLSFVTVSTAGLSNGTSNIAILNNGNITFSVGGNANVGVVTGTGLNVAGTLNATGNANVGNIGATNGVFTNVSGNGANLSSITGANVTGQVGNALVAGTVYTAAQPNITSVGTLTGLGVNGTVTAVAFTANTGVFTGNGSGLSAIAGANVTGTVANATFATSAGTATTAGSATTAGTVTTNAQPNITSVGTLSSLNVSGNANVGNIGATNGVFTNVSGNGANLSSITGSNVTGQVSFAATANAVAGANVSGQVGNALVAGTVYTAAQPNITSVGTLTSLGVNGNITAANITANTGVFAGNGSGLTALNASNISTGTLAQARLANASVTLGSTALTLGATVTTVTGLSSVTSTTFVGSLTGAATTAGTVTTNAQPNITSVGTLSSLSVTGNANVGNIGVNNAVIAGSATFGGNVNMGNFNIINLAEPVNATDAATKQYVDDLAQGLHTHDSCGAATPDTLANITGGTITYNNGTAGVGANLVTTGSFNLIDGVNVQTAGTRILVKNEANSAHNGIYTWSNATVITRATDFDTPTEMAGGDFTFVTAGTLYDSTGWVMTDAVTTIGTSPISWTQFSGAGTYTAGTGLTLTGSQFSVNVAQPTITSVGTLTGLNVNGNIIAANITANTGRFSGNGSGLTNLAGANVTGQVGNALVAGTVYTAAQPNITSVGTLTSLGVNGNITAANITANTGVFTGNGAGLTNIAGANVTGQVGNALVAGTVYTAAQPNITSVGTLTSLNVSGNANVGNLGTARVIATGNISGTQLISNIATGTAPLVVTSTTTVANLAAATAGSATTAGTVTTAAQPNITSVGTLTSLSVTGNVATGNISGTNGNLTTANISGNLILGNASVTTAVSYGSVTTTAITANQTIASFSATGVTGVEFLVKSIDSAGSKYGVATVIAVTDGTNVDYSTYGTVNLGGYTGALAVNVVGGQVRLQVTPASSNSTVWTTQYRLI